jgi:hypothetical protein
MSVLQPPQPRKRPWPRRLERALLGAMMSVVAFVIERRVLKSIRKGGKDEKPVDTSQRGLQGGLGKDGIAVQPKMKRLAVPSEKIDR